MIEWSRISTVLLDMDGTLLDLHYDNHFWLSHVPQRHAEKHGWSFDASLDHLTARYRQVAGTMEWYCVDYWTRELGLDIASLKEEIRHLIAVHPHVADFLAWARLQGRRVILVTNAHHKSLSLKMRHTGLDQYFDAIICAHEFGVPKEHPDFWRRLRTRENFYPGQTLLVDDSIPVLRSARDYGIAYLLSVRQPDSRQAAKDSGEFRAIHSFSEIMPATPPPQPVSPLP